LGWVYATVRDARLAEAHLRQKQGIGSLRLSSLPIPDVSVTTAAGLDMSRLQTDKEQAEFSSAIS